MRCLPSILLLFALVSTPLLAQPDAARRARLSATVDALVGKKAPGRRAALIATLRRDGIAHVEEEFANQQVHGFNIVCSLPGTGPRLVLSAHYDCLSTSPGANDNASGCAVLLELLRELRKRKRRAGDQEPVAIDVVFLAGSKASHSGAADYCRRREGKGCLGAINLDVVGLGPHLLVGPRAGRGDNEILRSFVEAAGPKQVITHTVAEQVIGSDHRAFAQAGLDAITVNALTPELAVAVREAAGQGRRGRREKTALDRALAPNRDVRAAVSLDGLEATTVALLRWLSHVGQQRPLPRPIRPGYGRDLARFARSMSRVEPETMGTRVGEHVEAMARLGARGSMLALMSALEGRRGARARPAVQRLLETFASGTELRQGLKSVFDSPDEQQVARSLRELYDACYRRLRWDPERLVIGLADG